MIVPQSWTTRYRLYFDHRGLGIDLDDHRVNAAGRAAAVGTEIRGALQAGLSARTNGAAQRVGLSEPARPARDRDPSRSRSNTRPPASSKRSRGTPSNELARVENLLSHRHRRRMTRAAGDDRTTTGKCTGAPMKFARVAGHHAHIFDIDAERIGNELREHREVPLPLRADAGRAAHLSARLDGDARAFVRPDAGALDVTRHADADPPPLRAQLRLLLADELLVSDHLGGLIQRRLVVAAVVNERRRVLKHDLVIDGKLSPARADCACESRHDRCQARARRNRAAAR